MNKLEQLKLQVKTHGEIPASQTRLLSIFRESKEDNDTFDHWMVKLKKEHKINYEMLPQNGYPFRIYKLALLLLLLIPFISFGQTWTDTIPSWDHDDTANIQIEYSGDWVHMNGKGSYPNADNSTATFKFWGKGIDVYTEEHSNHSFYTITIDGEKDTVNIDGSKNLDNSLTFSNHDLFYGNHTVVFEGPKYGYVLNALVKYVDYSPIEQDSVIVPPPSVPDTVYIYVYDTVRYYYKPVFDYELVEEK